MDIFEELLNLFLPSSCIICAATGSSVCSDCLQKFRFAPNKVSRHQVNHLTGFATCEYTPEIAKIIHEYKEGHQTALAKVMTPAMSKALQNFELANTYLVPIPSKRKSFTARGFEPATVLGKALARQVAKDCKFLLPVKQILSFSHLVADQASLGGQDRRINLVGSMVAKLPRDFGDGPRVILVDDIVTTGATMAEAYRCLTSAGVEVIGFVAFAETLPRNRQNVSEKSV